MNIEFKSSFVRDLKGIKDNKLYAEIRRVIERAEQAQSLQEMSDVKKLRGGDHYYRIRVGDYRIGVRVEGNTLTFVRVLHRREIYRYFP